MRVLPIATRHQASRMLAGALVVASTLACGGAGPVDAPTAVPASSTGSQAPGSPPPPTPFIGPAVAFPVGAFGKLSTKPLGSQPAATLQAELERMAGTGGMTATLITADGIWSGAAGKADGVHDLVPDSQFGIASITKTIVAAQVMQLVEAGELSLDAPVSEYLPVGLEFDTNGATVRQLLSHRSGIPDWYGDGIEKVMATDRSRAWTTAEVLALVPTYRSTAGATFAYGDTNYTLLGLAIEHVRKRSLVEVLRSGVLDVPGTDRLVYQPAEAPTAPMAMPDGEPPSALELGKGYLPSLSDASSAGPAGAIASDSVSLARWWRAFCAGEIVSEASLTEMSRFYDGPDGYGLGLFNVADPWAAGVGHAGENFGFVSSAGCLSEDAVVVVVLANYHVDDIGGMGKPLVDAIRR